MKRKTTKEILAESFRELAADRAIDKITVQEIVNNCGYSSATFYRHFKDKYDLIAWDYARQIEKVMSRIGTDGYTWKRALWMEALPPFWPVNIPAKIPGPFGTHPLMENIGRRRSSCCLPQPVRSRASLLPLLYTVMKKSCYPAAAAISAAEVVTGTARLSNWRMSVGKAIPAVWTTAAYSLRRKLREKCAFPRSAEMLTGNCECP